MATNSTAKTHWEGTLKEGEGTTELTTSGVGAFDVLWGKREKAGEGTTNPEELIAAALATCYSMALANGLTEDGHPPTTIDTSVTVGFQPGKGITGAEITVVGDVAGIDADQFTKYAEDTKENCPVSKALAGVEKTLNVDFTTK